MPMTIEIDDNGHSVVSIPDADGECHAYRWRIIAPDFSLWALLLTRTDTDACYRVAEESPGSWSCSCPAEKYRKRGTEHCKHCAAARSLRAFLNHLVTEERTHERDRRPVRSA